MTDKNIEMMKKIIEEKKKKSSEQSGTQRAQKNAAGKASKAKGGRLKSGGVTDK
ncbi:MAG: hypothetical protein H7Y18_00855 [Clostridiaceae bacterium]|nr:hypothetical protein [Clostridiaceae bacterium]